MPPPKGQQGIETLRLERWSSLRGFFSLLDGVDASEKKVKKSILTSSKHTFKRVEVLVLGEGNKYRYLSQSPYLYLSRKRLLSTKHFLTEQLLNYFARNTLYY